MGNMDEVNAFLEAHPEVRILDVLNYDLSGVMRGKRVDVEQMKKLYKSGFQFPSSVVLLDVTGYSSDPDGRGFSDGDPDSDLLPIPGTLTTVPWKSPDVAQVLTSYYEQDGTAMVDDPRHVLGSVVKQLADMGLKPVVACELEFYLLDPVHGENGEPRPPIMPQSGRRPAGGQVYSMAEMDEFADFMRDIAKACEIQGIPAGPASAEYAAGQFEVNLNHVDDPVAACDHSALLQRVIRGVAIKHGYEATFMSKPFIDGTGNGLHIHCSLLDNDGNNIFDDGTEEGSDKLRHAIGGMLETMPEAMAIFAPNINSYRRLTPDSFVPTCKAWAYNNRSTALRVPGGDSAARRFEHRVAGADANPYLTMAAMLAGAMHGLKNKIEPPEVFTGNAGVVVDADMPLTCQRGLDALEAASILPKYLTETYCRRYRLTKQDELDRFNDMISAREYEWYLMSR